MIGAVIGLAGSFSNYSGLLFAYLIRCWENRIRYVNIGLLGRIVPVSLTCEHIV